MKYRIAMALVLVSVSAGASAVSHCQEKAQEIQREIRYAQKHHNQQRIDGLNKALREVKAHCDDDQLRADHQQKIAGQKEEVAERQRDLQQAKQQGDADKIDKREHKLQQAQQKLNALESHGY